MEQVERMIEWVVCGLDSLTVVVYGSLTALVYLSAALPQLQREVAAHGKTREGRQQGNRPEPRGSPQWMMVPKKRFGDFYVCGLVALTATFLVSTFMGEKYKKDRPVFSGSLLALYYLHLLRRLYECWCVHQWREASQMHLAGYLVGIVHYVWLPFVFVHFPPGCCDKNSEDDRLAAEAEVMPEPIPTEHLSFSWWFEICSLPPIILGVWGQYQQHLHHVLLARLRTNSKAEEAAATTSIRQQTPPYRLPAGGWFSYVTCPHYLAEILVYVSFALLVELMQQIQQQQLPGSYWPRDGRHWVMLLWVISNLTLSARINYQWYQENLPASAMKGRKAIFPLLF